jgi:SAM-dependent methyltransferase
MRGEQLKGETAPKGDFFSKMLQNVGQAGRLLFGSRRGLRRCPACGLTGEFVSKQVLWPELIAQWELSPQWVHWFDQREGCACAGCGSSLRSGQLARVITDEVQTMTEASGTCLSNLFEDPRVQALRIAEINSAGTLHQFLSKCPNLRYSEYGGTSPGIPSESLMHLSYADSSFDLVVTSETLEHVPDIDVALSEVRRVLKPGGTHIFTVPVVWERAKTRQRAYIQNGTLVHALPPSYHGSRPEKETNGDYLVFYEFGVDFVERCRGAEFDIRVVRDKENPALAVFIARKQIDRRVKP